MAQLEAGSVVTGAELATLDEPALDAATRQASVFARVTPQQKLRIVRSLQRQGEVVAMAWNVKRLHVLRAA